MAELVCAIITRNRGSNSKSDGSSFLIKTLDSFMINVGCACRLIVVNDASDDDSKNLIDEWAVRWIGLQKLYLVNPPLPKIKTVHLTNHTGIGGSMNSAVLPILNPDDIVVRFDDDILFNCQDWGQRVLDTFAAEPKLVSLGGRQIDPRGWIICFGDRIIGPVYRHHWSQYHPDSMEAPADNEHVLFPVQSVMGAFGAFRADALKAIGGYDRRFLKLRCETEDVHCEFLKRGWLTAVRFGLDITHWSDPTFEHAAPDKAWGCDGLNEAWFEKWGFLRTGLTSKNAFDPALAGTRVEQIVNCGHPELVKRLRDHDFDETPGVVGPHTVYAVTGTP